MKLIDPNDGQLNAAFAEHVCGWSPKLGAPCPLSWKLSLGQRTPNFCASADAVLPHLEKLPEFEIHAAAYSPIGCRYKCRVWPKMTQTSGANDFVTAYADTISRACVLALLRSKGVEIEFSK